MWGSAQQRSTESHFIFYYDSVQTEGINLDQRQSHRILFDVVFYSVAHSDNKLVRDHKNQDVSSFHRLNQVWNSQLKKSGTFLDFILKRNKTVFLKSDMNLPH